MKTAKIHWTLLSLLLIFIPPFFLIFTEEGNRISDNAILWLFGKSRLHIDFKEADGQFSQDEFIRAFPDIDWRCGKLSSQFGDTACNASIGTFNELPSRRIVAYFGRERLRAMQISYRAEYHQSVIQHLRDLLGKPDQAGTSGDVLEWNTGKGVVVLKKSIQPVDEAALMWLAK